MRAIGAYILKGRAQAIGITSFLTIISLLLPPLAYLLSGVPVSLVTLRHGAVFGLHVIFGSLFVIIVIFAVVAQISPQIALAFAIEIWTPLWLCALVLRFTESQGKLVAAAGGFAALYILITHALTDNVTEWWRNNLDKGIAPVLPVEMAGQYQTVLEEVVPYLNGMMAGSILVSMVLTIIVARWWQSILYNPGGFKKEFLVLQLPRALLIAVLASAGLVGLGEVKPGSWIVDLLILIMFMYLFQGIATIHRAVVARGMPRIWLIILYVMIFIPQVSLFLACLGMVDSWLSKKSYAGVDDNS